MADVELQITAKKEGLERALAESAKAVERAASDIKSKFDKVDEIFGKVQRAVVGMTAVLAGGEAFRAMISKTVEATYSSTLLGRQLGISATQASELREGLDDVFATTDQFSGAVRGLTNTLKSNEGAFAALGVSTRTSSGELRSTFDIMLDVNTALAGLKQGTDRNIEASKIFGRQWQEIEPVLNLTRERMAQSAESARQLGLIVGTESVESVFRYKAAMNDANDVVDAAGKVIADALLPILSDFAEWFASIGPEAISVFRKAIAGIISAFYGLRLSFQIAFETMKAGIEQLVVLFVTIADVGARALVFDFSGARAAWSRGLEQIEDIGERWKDKLIANATEARDRMAAAWSDPKQTPTAGPGGGASSTPDTERNRVSEFAARLEELKAQFSEEARLRGQFLEFSKERERDYWSDILANERLSQTEKIAIRSKVAQLSLAIDRAAFEGELAELRTREAEYSANLDARLELARQFAERVKAAYGEDSKNYQDAARRIVEIEREKQAQLRQIRELRSGTAQRAALAEIDAENELARLMVDLGLRTEAELIEQERAFEERRFAVRLAALQERLKLAELDPDRNPVEVARLNAEIEGLEVEHHGRMREIRAAGIREQSKDWRGMFSTMESGFSGVIAQFLRGTLSIGQAVRGLFVAVGEAVIQTLANIAARWIVTQLLQRAASKVTSLSTIAGHAATAGAAAFASTAAIPIVGPALAPAAAAAAYGGALSFAALIPAARMGFDVPAGLNPVTQLHAREMVLPEPLADVIRSMADGEGSGAARPISIQVSALDGRSAADWLRRGGAAEIARALRTELSRMNSDVRP